MTSGRRLVFAAGLIALSATVGVAQAPDTTVTLRVTLDRADWRYHTKEAAGFHVALVRAGKPIDNARVRVEVGLERMRPDRVDTVTLTNGQATVTGTLAEPGFLRATASTVVDGNTYTQFATAAFDPENIVPTTTMPADFETFWRDALAAARRVPLVPIMTRIAEQSTPEVDVYHVSFQNQRVGSRIYGMLSVPARPGKYPAILVVPGAGVRPYFPNVATARRGVIHLRIGVHGIPVDRDSLLYNELRATALQNYWSFNLDDRDNYYYKRIYVAVVRAGDFLFGLPQFDGRNYAVQGGSQGGGLAIVAGALDPRVRAIASSHPAMSDHFGYLHGRASGWPHIFADTTGMKAKAEKMETLRYYDVVNFARLLPVPGIYTWGFNDRTTPPTSVFAAYNVIRAPKESVIAPDAGHFSTKVQNDRIDAWLMSQLGVLPLKHPPQ